MAINPHNRGPLRAMSVLVLLIFGLYGLLGAVSTKGTAQRTPKLGLDLSGGTELILTPKLVGNQQINQGQILKAVDIIRARVNGSGVTEAEVSTQGGKDIVISLPGTPDPATVASLQKSSKLSMRATLVEASTTATPVPTATGPSPLKPTGEATSNPKASTPATTAPKSGFPPALTAATTPAPSATPTAATPTTAPATGAKPQNPSDLAWVTPALQKQLADLNCADPKSVEAIVDDPAKPMVTCDAERPLKYILGPAEVFGTQISNATSGQQTTQGGSTSGVWEVRLDFNSAGTKTFCDLTSRITVLPSPRNQGAIVLDNKVISNPVPQAALCAGNASITGSFTAASSKVLADQLKFGALPLSFRLQTSDQISPTLGGDQLARGLIAGGIGLLLVVAYSLFQYRALGLVTVSSLTIAGLLTYALVTLFGWSQGFRLTMAGVTGLIVSIGIVADSFILYFERVRDEVRDGRALRAAVETGWNRARRTILISDAVNFLAAVVLYALAASNVRGFAFTLMLTTMVDIVVVFLFTHPLLSILANTKFFGEGHKWSGLDRKRLGARNVTYAGRGRVTIAARRAAATEGNQS
ncbi:MAG: protein translocase subunit SecD [Actinomycetota bacterium]